MAGPQRFRAVLIGLALTAAATVGAQEAEDALPPIAWQPCDSASGVEGTGAECATVSLPADYAAPADGTIDVAIGRLLNATPTTPRTELWYLSGGPGDSGIEALGRLSETLGSTGVDLYTLDHRGVGNTELLRCPEQEAEDSDEGREITTEEWPACITWLRESGRNLDILTTDASAQDLGRVIERVGAGDGQTVIFGASYGTYWANTYLRYHPEQPAAVILDGLVPADWTFAEFDSVLDDAGRRLVQLCIRSSECASHLGPTPSPSPRPCRPR